MASSGYSLPSYLTSSSANDADVDQLLEQFEEESMLNLRLGSHRIGAADLEPLASEDFMPAYLQDDDGGLDKDLGARLSALKAPRKAPPRKVAGPVAARHDRPKSGVFDKKEGPSGGPEPSDSKECSGADTAQGAGRTSDFRRKLDEGKPQGVSASIDGAVDFRDVANELDPHDVAPLGVDLATRLHLLKARPGGGQKGGQVTGQSKERDGVSQPDLPKSEKRGTTSTQRTVPPIPSASTENPEKAGTPFVDLSRGRKAQSGDPGKVSRGSWSNPLAGLFGRPRGRDQPGSGSDVGAKESEGPDAAEMRAQVLLAGVTKAGSSRKNCTRKEVGGGASIDRNSALFRDLQGVAGAGPEHAYEEVKTDEEKERLEAEALIAALHDDMRLRRGTAGRGSGEVDISADSDTGSDTSEKPSKSQVKELASWAVDAARLEGLDSDEGSLIVRNRKGARSSDEGTDSSSSGSGSDSDDPPSKKKATARKRTAK